MNILLMLCMIVHAAVASADNVNKKIETIIVADTDKDNTDHANKDEHLKKELDIKADR